jgi:GT2 family glycosyltransferase
VSVVLPAYGSPEPLLAAVDRLLDLTNVHIEVIVVDNDPPRGLPGLLPSAPRLRLIEPGYNSGFAAAINAGVDASRGEFLLFHNADLLIDGDYLALLVDFMRERPNAGAASGKILRPPAVAGAESLIDSAGITVRRDRGAFDRGEGKPDRAFDTVEEVFAVSGAALFARRAALDDVAVGGHCLAPAFFMYKDDVDLCWRLRLRGWECWFVPAARAHHLRSGRGLGGRGYLRGLRTYLRNERAKPRHVRLHSLKNEWLLLVHNESFATLVPDLPRIIFRQALLAGSTLLLSPTSFFEAVRLAAGALPGAIRWRRDVRRRAVVDNRDIRARWFLP